MTSEQRSRNMAAVKSKGTKPELLVRRWLWSHGYRYRLNVKSVPGSPDVVMRPYRTAIFVNGCFWHGHEGCKKATTPKTNNVFWSTKITRNRERDQENYQVLQKNGWQVIVIWECQLTPTLIDHTMREVELLLNENMLSLYRHNPIPYNTEEEGQMPMAAENQNDSISPVNE